MDKNIRISILGCGWLGLPLAEELIRNGYNVSGSTTSSDKLSDLSSRKIDSFLVQFNPKLSGEDLQEFFRCDVLIITIPPKKDPGNYLMQIQELAKIIPEREIKKVIYISSTSVYGNTNRAMSELDFASADSDSGKALLKTENLLMNNPSFKTTVVRFGGLIGPGRDPGRFLSGKTAIGNGLAPVNLIHLDDCIGIIKSILDKDVFGEIFNACSPDHPSRKDFYTLASGTSGLELPEVIDELQDWKIINSIHVSEFLNYKYKVEDWLSWLKSGKA